MDYYLDYSDTKFSEVQRTSSGVVRWSFNDKQQNWNAFGKEMSVICSKLCNQMLQNFCEKDFSVIHEVKILVDL